MKLMHYSAKPIELDRTRTYDLPENRSYLPKPYGLWVSVEGEQDWPSWCRDEEWGLDRLVHAYEVTLTSEARILYLQTPGQVRRLAQRYPEVQRPPSILEPMPDWEAIASDFSGIVIAPYQWSCRMSPDTFWYYGWDCASGCIWDLSVVESIIEIKSEVSA